MARHLKSRDYGILSRNPFLYFVCLLSYGCLYAIPLDALAILVCTVAACFVALFLVRCSVLLSLMLFRIEWSRNEWGATGGRMSR